MKPKINVVACADNFHFIQDLIPALSDEFDIKTLGTNGEFEARVSYNRLTIDCDLVWLEWADGFPLGVLDSIAEYSHLEGKKIILRLHRYELFTPRTLKQIESLPKKAIDRIDKLVFVSKIVRRIGIDKFPWMEDSVVIPNLIDHVRFPFTNRERGFNIMILGRLIYGKNLPMALSMFNELSKIDPRYQLHVVGNIPDLIMICHLENFIKKTSGLNIHCYGRIDNDKLPEFMKNMHFILNAAIFEGQGIGVLESMCCGLKPVIFNYPGAENMFPSKWIWIDFNQFEKIITGSYDSEHYHKFVIESYSIEENIYNYKNLIYEVLNV